MLKNNARERTAGQKSNYRYVYQEKGFSVQVRLEKSNQLLWVTDYEIAVKDNFYSFLWELARKHGAGKIVFPLRPYDLYLLKNERFVMEGYVDGFFAGVPGCFLAGYPKPGRALSSSLAKEQRLLSRILTSPRKETPSLPAGIKIRPATENDAPFLSLMLQENPGGITSSIKKGDIYLAAWRGDQLAGVASAACDLKYGRAEIVHCLTLPEHQNNGLTSALLRSLQEKCRSLGIKCLYYLARASSYQANFTFHSLGYLFRGTLINNRYTKGQFENINIWVYYWPF